MQGEVVRGWAEVLQGLPGAERNFCRSMWPPAEGWGLLRRGLGPPRRCGPSAAVLAGAGRAGPGSVGFCRYCPWVPPFPSPRRRQGEGLSPGSLSGLPPTAASLWPAASWCEEQSVGLQDTALGHTIQAVGKPRSPGDSPEAPQPHPYLHLLNHLCWGGGRADPPAVGCPESLGGQGSLAGSRTERMVTCLSSQ